MTGAEFVRSRPKNMPVEQILAEAEAMGINLDKGSVYRTRSYDRLKAKKKGEKPESAGSSRKGQVKPGSSTERVLQFLRSYLPKQKGVAPHRAVIADALAITPQKVSQAMTHLKAYKLIDYPKSDATAVYIVEPKGAPVRAKANGKSNGVAQPSSIAGLLGPRTDGAASLMRPPPEHHETLRRDLGKLREELEAKLAAVDGVIALLG